MFKLNRGFESRAGQIKDYNVDICCFFPQTDNTKEQEQGLMVRDNDNVSVCNNMSNRGMLCQWAWLD